METIYTYSEDSPSGLVFRVKRGNRRAGSPVGCKNAQGYWVTTQGKLVHRIIWELIHGPIPDGLTLDHKDGNPANNKADNLRLATRAQQRMNNKQNGYGPFKGKFRCQLKKDGVRYYALVATEAEAREWVHRKREELFGEFHRHH